MILNSASQDQLYNLDNALNVERQRISNIITHNNDTEGNSELIDIRTDANGGVYNSAGDAVRSQITNLTNRIDYDRDTVLGLIESLGLVVKNGMLCAKYNIN